MHESATRLYEAAKLLAKRTGQSAVADLLGVSPQNMYMWERRGVSNQGAINAASTIGKGLRADWIIHGIGQMTDGDVGAQSGVATVSESTPLTGYLYSDTKFVRAPAVEWARLETDLTKGVDEFSESEFFEFLRTKKHSNNVRLVMVQDDTLGPRLRRGDFVAFDLENKAPERNQVALFRSGIDGAYFIRRFVPVAGGMFNAVAVSGENLNSERDQLTIVGSACGMAVSDI